MLKEILSRLPAEHPWQDRVHYFSTIGSTNDEARRLARQGAPCGTVLIAETQTGGHGRRGRSFHSPASSGIYLSVILRPNCAATELMHLTCAAAVAVCDAVERSAGFRPGIKWTNDIVHGKRKLGGILTELGFHLQGSVDYAIIGIGLNCSQRLTDFPQEIQEFAGSLEMFSKDPIDRSAVASGIILSLSQLEQTLLTAKDHILRQYRADCITLGKDVLLLRGDEVRYGRALDIDSEGGLIVQFDTGTETVNSGEISVRGMYGYI